MKLLTLIFTCLLFLSKSQDTLHYNLHSETWAYLVDSLLIEIDKKEFTEYYNFEGKQIPKISNTPLLIYYRGTRKKVFVFN